MDFNAGESPYSRNTFGESSVPYIINLKQEALTNTHFFAARWTDQNLQFAHMSVLAGMETGWNVYYDSTLFFYIEQGEALVLMGFCQECVDIQERSYAGHTIIVPAGTWYNVKNIGLSDLKLFAIFSPPVYSYNAAYRTKDEWTLYNGH